MKLGKKQLPLKGAPIMFKSFFAEKNKKKFLESITSLYILQFTNQIFPVIMIPYLTRTLGMGNYGIFQFGLIFANYLYILIDYGYSLSAPRDIVRIKKDLPKLSKYFFNVQYSKIFLFFLCGGIVFILFSIFDVFNLYEPICWIFLIFVFGQITFPVWFFQGMENIKVSSIMSLIMKVLQLVIILVLIQNDNDLFLAAYIFASLTLLQSFISFIFIIIKYKLTIKKPKYKEIISSLRTGWILFISQASTTLFSNLNVIILGAFATPEIVGSYALGERIVRTAVSLISPLNRVIYPLASKRFSCSEELGVKFVSKILKSGIIIFSLVSIVLFVLAIPITKLFTNSYISDTSLVIRILSILPLSIFLNNMFGNQIMLNIGKENTFKNIILSTGIMCLVLAAILVPKYMHIGMAIASLLSEMYIMIVMYLVVRSVLFKKARYT